VLGARLPGPIQRDKQRPNASTRRRRGQIDHQCVSEEKQGRMRVDSVDDLGDGLGVRFP
jgi:hypothetical protein